MIFMPDMALRWVIFVGVIFIGFLFTALIGFCVAQLIAEEFKAKN